MPNPFSPNRLTFRAYPAILWIGIGWSMILGLGGLWGCRTIKPSRQVFFAEQKEVPQLQLTDYRSVQARPHQHPRLALAAGVSGGGSRAYAFTMGVMLGLEALSSGPDGQNLLQEVDYWSSASGGAFSTALYFAARKGWSLQNPNSQFSLASLYDPLIKKALSRSYAAPAVYGRLDPRVWVSHLDNGDYLEKRLDRKLLAPFLPTDYPSLRLGDFYIPQTDSQQVLHPLPIINATTFKGMVIFPFAPNVIRSYQISGYTHLLKKYYPDTLIDPYEMPLSVAMKASGTFPGAITATTLRSEADSSRPYLHLFDAGVSDNQGYRMAMAALRQEDQARRKRMIVIDVDHSPYGNLFKWEQHAPFFLTALLRMPTSGLEHRRNMRDTYLADYAAAYNFEVAYVDFGVLVRDNPAPIPPKIKIPEERKRLLHKLRTDYESIDGIDRQILFELLVHIKTKYTLKDWELDLLVEGGKYIVWLQRETLLSWVDF